jgi:hypothetical protein
MRTAVWMVLFNARQRNHSFRDALYVHVKAASNASALERLRGAVLTKGKCKQSTSPNKFARTFARRYMRPGISFCSSSLSRR